MNDDAVSLPSRSWARLPVASAAVTYLAFALPTSMLGVMWPDVRHRFHQPSGALGLVLLSYGISRMATALSGRRLSDAFGLGRSFIATLVVLMLVCLALAVSPSWLVFLLAVAGLGAVSGALDSLGAGFITAKRDGGVAGLIHGSYGLGATLGPLAVAFLPGWRLPVLGAAVVAGGAVAVASRAARAWSPPDKARVTPIDSRPISRRAVAISLALLATMVAVEVTTGQWAHTYLTDHRHLSDTLAAIGVAGFWGGATIGRLAMSVRSVAAVVQRISGATLAACGAAMVVTLGFVPPSMTPGVLSLMGVALAPIVPLFFAGTARRVGSGHAPRLAGWQLLATNVGAISVPSITGRLVDSAGPGAIVIVVAVLILAIGVPLLVVSARLPDLLVPRPTPLGVTEAGGASANLPT